MAPVEIKASVRYTMASLFERAAVDRVADALHKHWADSVGANTPTWAELVATPNAEFGQTGKRYRQVIRYWRAAADEALVAALGDDDVVVDPVTRAGLVELGWTPPSSD